MAKRQLIMAPKQRYRINVDGIAIDISSYQRRILNYVNITWDQAATEVGRPQGVEQILNGLVTQRLFDRTKDGARRTKFGTQVLKAFVAKGK